MRNILTKADRLIAKIFKLRKIWESRYPNLALILIVIISLCSPPIIVYQINQYFDERKIRDTKNDLELSVLDELVLNVRVLQFDYWSMKKKWTPNVDISNTQRDLFVSILNTSLKTIYRDDNLSDIINAYKSFDKISRNIEKMKTDKFVSKESYDQYIALLKKTIDDTIELSVKIKERRNISKYNNIDYLSKSWDRDDILKKNCIDFYKNYTLFSSVSTDNQVMFE